MYRMNLNTWWFSHVRMEYFSGNGWWICTCVYCLLNEMSKSTWTWSNINKVYMLQVQCFWNSVF